MEKIKKIFIVLLLVISILCLLVACGENDDSNLGEQNQTVTNGDNTGVGNGDTSGDNNGTSGGTGGTPPVGGGEEPATKNSFVYELNAESTGYVLKSANITQKVVTIPATYNDLPVIKIEKQAFYSIALIEEVNIPDTIEEIGERAFSLCVGLEKVNITTASQLEVIGDRAFFECDRLNTITLPDGLKVVGEEAFSGCYDLIELTFTQNLVEVGANAFNCGWYDAITENGIIYVGNVAYGYIDNSETPTPQDLVLRDGTIAIAGKAFYGNDNISGITIPASVINIGALALNNLGELATISVDENNAIYSSEGNTLIEKDSTTLLASTPTSVVPAYVEVVGEEAFAYLDGITSVFLPDTVKRIMKGAFKGSSVTSVNIPYQVTTIEEETFLSCENLQNITIPSHITTIERSSFNYCLSLEVVTVESEGIYDSLDLPYACSGLVARATTIYIKDTLSGQADLLISDYEETTTDKLGYRKFIINN